MRYYRRKTEDPKIRRGRKRLFIPFKDNNNQKEISSASISRWITTTIAKAHADQGEDSTLRKSLNIRAHDVRAVATSLLQLEGASVTEVMRAGRWASGGTFTRFYLRDMIPQADKIAKSGPVVAGGQVVSLSKSSERHTNEHTT